MTCGAHARNIVFEVWIRLPDRCLCSRALMWLKPRRSYATTCTGLRTVGDSREYRAFWQVLSHPITLYRSARRLAAFLGGAKPQDEWSALVLTASAAFIGVSSFTISIHYGWEIINIIYCMLDHVIFDGRCESTWSVGFSVYLSRYISIWKRNLAGRPV
jgi:hypothetical protein